MASLSHVYLHYVWSVAKRRPAIRKRYRRELAEHIANRCLRHNCSAIAIGIVSDHMHLLVRHHLTVYIPDFVKDIKGASSHFMNERYDLPDVFRWQGGYAAHSVSHELLDAKIGYIKGQEQHHADQEARAAAYWSDRAYRETPLKDRTEQSPSSAC